MPVYIDNRELREEAKALLRSASVSPFRFTALLLAINIILNLVTTAASYKMGTTLDFTQISAPQVFAMMLVSLFSTVLVAGYNLYCLGVHEGREMRYGTLFSAFPFAGKVILLSVLQGVLIGAGLMLFIVPGIYFAFAYAFAVYHLCLDPEAGVIDAMRRSRLELRGGKWQLFSLFASFFPLLLLFAVPVALCEYFLSGFFPDTLAGELLHSLVYDLLTGVAALYMTPYIALSEVGFFRRLIKAQSGEAQPPENEENSENNEENRLD